MYFRYRIYKKCIPATICSFGGGAFVAGGIVIAVSSVMEKDFGAVAAGVLLALVGAGLYVLADKIADRKMNKLAEKEAIKAAIKAEAEAKKAASNVCPHCGTTLAPDDVFCYNCGTKRS